MAAIKVLVRIADDHSLSGMTPEGVPAGEYEATITAAERLARPKFFRVEDLPTRDLPWDGAVSLRREDLYGDDVGSS